MNWLYGKSFEGRIVNDECYGNKVRNVIMVGVMNNFYLWWFIDMKIIVEFVFILGNVNKFLIYIE